MHDLSQRYNLSIEIKDKLMMVNNPTPPLSGEPLNLTDEQLDQLAEITPADIAAMRARARRNPELRRMIEAVPTNSGESEE